MLDEKLAALLTKIGWLEDAFTLISEKLGHVLNERGTFLRPDAETQLQHMSGQNEYFGGAVADAAVQVCDGFARRRQLRVTLSRANTSASTADTSFELVDS